MEAETYIGLARLEGFLRDDRTVRWEVAREIRAALIAWHEGPTTDEAQRLSRTMARLIGRNPDDEWVGESERSTGFLSAEAIAVLPRAHGWAEYWMKQLFPHENAKLYRGVGDPVFAAERKSYTVALNTLSSWTTNHTAAEIFARQNGVRGAVLSMNVGRDQVVAILQGTVPEFIVLSPRAFVDFPSAMVEHKTVAREMAAADGDAVAYIDNDVNCANWLSIVRAEQQEAARSFPTLEERAAFEVQTVICPKRFWSEGEARSWVKAHGYRTDKIDETSTSYRFRQEDPSLFARLRTICINPGGAKPGSDECKVEAVGGPKK